MRVLITDGESRSALAATRSLGRAGHTVFVASLATPCLAGTSRHAFGVETYANPNQAPAQFVESVVTLVAMHQIDVVLPMTDVSTLLLAANRRRLPPGCLLPLAPLDALNLAANKAATLQLASELGIPTPKTRLVENRLAAAHLDQLEFPLVVKPARSRVLVKDHWLSTRVTYARDPVSLRSQLESLPDEAYPVLLQERIVGPGVGTFTCIKGGKAVALFAHRRIREKPPSGGVSVLCESTALDPVAVEYATKLLNAMGWEGVAMVEFKRDDRDGSLRLMEINGRFWGSLQLAIDSGVDFPRLLVESQEPLTSAPGSYEIGVRTRWFWGDFDSMLALIFKPASSLNLAPGHPGRFYTLLNFLTFFGPKQRGETLRLSDPLPGLFESWNWIRGRR